MSFTESFDKYSIDNYGYVRLPEIKISQEQLNAVGAKEGISNIEFLRLLLRKGFLEKKIPKDQWKKYGERINYEINIIDELGFIDYILLVWMVINKARELNVFLDFGRGSVSGSAVCWLLGVSGPDPIEKGLIFERFISRARAGKKIINDNLYLKGDLLADVDINLGDGREKIVEWLSVIYPNRVSKILNLSTFTTKILLKDVYKVYRDASEEDAQYVSGMIESRFGILQEIDEAYKENFKFAEWCNQEKEVVVIAKKLSGLIRQTSTHASGYLVSFYELDSIIPLESDKEGNIVSGYDMREVANFAVKLDLLGLSTNLIIKDILEYTKEDISKVNLDDDPFIYDRYQNNDLLPYGLYQISADCAYGVLNKIKPKNIYELSDLNALARPGALAYVDAYHNRTAVSPHPVFEKILAKSRYTCLYQEQMMQMSVAIGFTLEEAEKLRKIVGKKLIHEVAEWKDKIYKKCKENGFTEEIGDILWKILDDSSKYSFNLAHSVSTAYLSALTTYLKYKYPLVFYWACLKNVHHFSNPLDEITLIHGELKFFNIKLLPPDILNSKEDFTIEGNDIRMGLSAIKGLSESALQKIKSFRTTVSNRFDLYSSLNDANIPVNVVSALVLSGCFDSLRGNLSRNKFLFEFEIWNLLTDKELIYVKSFGSQYNYNLLDIIIALKDKIQNEKGKFIIKDSRFNTIKKNAAPFKEKYLKNSKYELLSNWMFEQKYIGFSYSNKLIDIYKKNISDLIPIFNIKNLEDKTKVRFVGIVESVEKRISREKKNPYLKIGIKDDSSLIVGMLFGDSRIEATNSFNGKEIEEGDIVVINGQKSSELVFIDTLAIQDNPIIMRKGQLKDLDKIKV